MFPKPSVAPPQVQSPTDNFGVLPSVSTERHGENMCGLEKVGSVDIGTGSDKLFAMASLS